MFEVSNGHIETVAECASMESAIKSAKRFEARTGKLAMIWQASFTDESGRYHRPIELARVMRDAYGRRWVDLTWNGAKLV